MIFSIIIFWHFWAFYVSFHTPCVMCDFKKKSKLPQWAYFISPLGSVLLHDKLPEIICEDKWVLWQTWVLIFFGGCQFLSGWQGTSAPALTTLQNWQPANITLVLAAPLQNTNAHKRNTEQTKTKHKCQPTNMARLLWNKWRWLQIWSTVHISINVIARCTDKPTSQRFKYSTAGCPLPG